MVKFGVRVRIWDTLPASNFVKIAQGISPLGEKFYQKFKISAIFSYLMPHYYTHNVKILFKRTNLGIHQRNKIFSKSLKGPVGIALPWRWCILISSFGLEDLVVWVSELLTRYHMLAKWWYVNTVCLVICGTVDQPGHAPWWDDAPWWPMMTLKGYQGHLNLVTILCYIKFLETF